MRPVTLTRTVHCLASRQQVWEHVSNTLRLNRAIGNSTLAVTEKEKGLGRFQLRCRLGSGFNVTYVEHPFSWSAGEYFSFYRVMLDSPARIIATRYDLADAPDGSGCVVTVRIDVTPRLSLLRPIVWLATRQSIGALVAFISSVDRRDVRPKAAPSFNQAAVDAARARLSARPPPALVARMAEHLRTADDFELSPIRPFALAAAWGEDRTSLLRLCLEAVPAGLLELRWGLLCPSCRTSATTLPRLRDLDGRGHCHACDLDFTTSLDRAVEAQFFPHASVRRLETGPYCIGGPALTPHVLSQAPLEKGATGALRAPAACGRLRLFVRGGATGSVEVSAGSAEEVTVTVTASGVEPAEVSVAPHGTLRLVNRSDEDRHAKLERSEWMSTAVTAHHVATMPEFRPLFGSEALRPGLALKVAHVAILFSDLCGSTALYSRVGDAPAFGIVTDCFAYGIEIVERHRGTVVKTIGDAVMAAFNDSSDAVAAGIEMIERWTAFLEAHPAAAALDLKVGAFAGPCTVVTANHTIDYFGQTVNSAARVQHLAGPRELVLAKALFDGVPDSAGVEVVERFVATVKGIVEPLPLVRLRPRAPALAG